MSVREVSLTLVSYTHYIGMNVCGSACVWLMVCVCVCVCVPWWQIEYCCCFCKDHEAAMEELKTEHAAALRKKETQVCVCV